MLAPEGSYLRPGPLRDFTTTKGRRGGGGPLTSLATRVVHSEAAYQAAREEAASARWGLGVAKSNLEAAFVELEAAKLASRLLSRQEVSPKEAASHKKAVSDAIDRIAKARKNLWEMQAALHASQNIVPGTAKTVKELRDRYDRAVQELAKVVGTSPMAQKLARRELDRAYRAYQKAEQRAARPPTEPPGVQASKANRAYGRGERAHARLIRDIASDRHHLPSQSQAHDRMSAREDRLDRARAASRKWERDRASWLRYRHEHAGANGLKPLTARERRELENLGATERARERELAHIRERMAEREPARARERQRDQDRIRTEHFKFAHSIDRPASGARDLLRLMDGAIAAALEQGQYLSDLAASGEELTEEEQKELEAIREWYEWLRQVHHWLCLQLCTCPPESKCRCTMLPPLPPPPPPGGKEDGEDEAKDPDGKPGEEKKGGSPAGKARSVITPSGSLPPTSTAPQTPSPTTDARKVKVPEGSDSTQTPRRRRRVPVPTTPRTPEGTLRPSNTLIPIPGEDPPESVAPEEPPPPSNRRRCDEIFHSALAQELRDRISELSQAVGAMQEASKAAALGSHGNSGFTWSAIAQAAGSLSAHVPQGSGAGVGWVDQWHENANNSNAPARSRSYSAWLCARDGMGYLRAQAKHLDQLEQYAAALGALMALASKSIGGSGGALEALVDMLTPGLLDKLLGAFGLLVNSLASGSMNDVLRDIARQFEAGLKGKGQRYGPAPIDDVMKAIAAGENEAASWEQIRGIVRIAQGANVLRSFARKGVLRQAKKGGKSPSSGGGGRTPKGGRGGTDSGSPGRKGSGEARGERSRRAATLQANRARGEAWERKVEAELRASREVVEPQITIRTKSGTRTRVDFATRDGESLRPVEAKSSATAPLTPKQATAFPEITESGGVVVGKGKPGVPGGTVIPPGTVVEIRRP